MGALFGRGGFRFRFRCRFKVRHDAVAVHVVRGRQVDGPGEGGRGGGEEVGQALPGRFEAVVQSGLELKGNPWVARFPQASKIEEAGG